MGHRVTTSLTGDNGGVSVGDSRLTGDDSWQHPVVSLKMNPVNRHPCYEQKQNGREGIRIN